ncbi:hypothetical protein Pmani_029075 [Petrolisthes manimaculis]|uniref:Uncharacterized protein n=1 Tax=Petrolisthes manimaculis TaxID=1843537 RepID=A0AAE1TUU1_9EUCA|nr:hypothetical protein Pmani_029075 [Petrolisthes manimaculis]
MGCTYLCSSPPPSTPSLPTTITPLTQPPSLHTPHNPSPLTTLTSQPFTTHPSLPPYHNHHYPHPHLSLANRCGLNTGLTLVLGVGLDGSKPHH